MPRTSDHDAFRFHLLRANYKAMVWINSFSPRPELQAPTEMGWELGEAGLESFLMSLCAIPVSCLVKYPVVVESNTKLDDANVENQD